MQSASWSVPSAGHPQIIGAYRPRRNPVRQYCWLDYLVIVRQDCWIGWSHMSKITPRDIESIVQLFEAGDWNALELRFGVTDLFLSKRPGDRPSWSKVGPGTPPDAPAAAPSAVSPPSKALSPEPAS